MQRKASNSRDNSTQTLPASPEFDAKRSIHTLQKRIAKLESSVADLMAARNAEFEGLPQAEHKRPGPKPRHGGMILSDRDRLVEMLECYWPEIEPMCLPWPNREGLKRVLESIPGQALGRHDYFAKHLLAHLPHVLRFVVSNRFRRDPRQIANAFAGFPNVSVWRSLKICQAKPCNNPIGSRAIRAYLRRKHPKLHGRLTADYSLTNFATAIRDYRTKDAKLNPFDARYLYKSWLQCLGNYQSLGLDPIDFKSQKTVQGG
jgi:hypothetical protein